MHNDLDVFGGDICVLLSEANGPLQQLFSDWWVEVDHVKADECVLLFFFYHVYALKPFDYGVGATPLIYTNSSSNGVVDFVQDHFADDAGFTFGGVDESAREGIFKIIVMVFQGDEGLFLCYGLHSVVNF